MRQYLHLFKMDNVDLRFTEEALETAARLAMERETGARGLRSIIESSLLDVMYEIPSRPEVRTVHVDEQVIQGDKRPVLLDEEGTELSFEEDRPLRDAA